MSREKVVQEIATCFDFFIRSRGEIPWDNTIRGPRNDCPLAFQGERKWDFSEQEAGVGEPAHKCENRKECGCLWSGCSFPLVPRAAVWDRHTLRG